MKFIYLILFCSLLNSSSDDIYGTYKVVDEIRLDSLEIRADGTYTYMDRGDSCWTWHNYSGTWMQDEDELILFYTQKYQKQSSDFHQDFFTNPLDSVKVYVQTIEQIPINDFKINYETSDYKLPRQTGLTDANGQIKFKKLEIVDDKNDPVYIEMKYLELGREVSSRSSFSRNADRIIITLDFEPDSVTEFLKHKFKVKEGYLMSTESKWIQSGQKYVKL